MHARNVTSAFESNTTTLIYSDYKAQLTRQINIKLGDPRIGRLLVQQST